MLKPFGKHIMQRKNLATTSPLRKQLKVLATRRDLATHHHTLSKILKHAKKPIFDPKTSIIQFGVLF